MALSAAAQERRKRATQVRGQGRLLGGATPRPRSGAAAERSYPESVVRKGGQEEPATQGPRPKAAARRTNPTSEARGCGWEGQPHVQGAVAAQAQEGLEELSHVEGQEGLR